MCIDVCSDEWASIGKFIRPQFHYQLGVCIAAESVTSMAATANVAQRQIALTRLTAFGPERALVSITGIYVRGVLSAVKASAIVVQKLSQ